MQRHLLFAVLILLALVCGVMVSRADDPVLINSFGSGDRFYVDPAEIRSVGGGVLEYYVQGVHNPGVPGASKTLNRVDCKTGQFSAALHTWRYDPSGQLLQAQAADSHPMQLSPSSGLYGILKGACQEMAPDTKIDW